LGQSVEQAQERAQQVAAVLGPPHDA